MAARAETPAPSATRRSIWSGSPIRWRALSQKLDNRRADHHRRHRLLVDRRRGRHHRRPRLIRAGSQAELKQRFPGHAITVLNRGVSGEEAADMLKRFDTAVIAAKPDLVLWQLGTNSVSAIIRLGDHGAAIRAGLAKIRAIGADVVLIDPQFAPKVIAKPEAAHMVELIATTAKQEDVDLFHRYDVMKRWYDVDHMKFETFVSPDGLHMNDWSYGCLAKGLGVAIAEAAAAAGVVGDRLPYWCRIAERQFFYTFSSAVSRSSIRSSGCSSPAEKRTSPSPMPSSARCSGVSR